MFFQRRNILLLGVGLLVGCSSKTDASSAGASAPVNASAVPLATSAMPVASSTARPYGGRMKEIVYRGGVIRFRVPADWKEEYEPEGGGTFYPEGDDGATFRLNVTTMVAPHPLKADAPSEVLRPGREPEPIEVLPTGFALRSYERPAVEKEQKLTIYYWELGQVIPPKDARIALFSLTVVAERVNEPDMVGLRELFDREVRQARFAKKLESD